MTTTRIISIETYLRNGIVFSSSFIAFVDSGIMTSFTTVLVTGRFVAVGWLGVMVAVENIFASKCDDKREILDSEFILLWVKN